jgi:hypothetical protein
MNHLSLLWRIAPMQRRLLILPFVLVFVTACDSELSDTLSWMDNTYNPHTNHDGAIGHGRSDWYGPREVLADGYTETFTHNGCEMTLHIEKDRPAGQQMYSSSSHSFNLSDINPQSIKAKPPFSHGRLVLRRRTRGAQNDGL